MPASNVQRSAHPGHLANSYLVVGEGREAILIDGNGVPDPLLAYVDARDVTVAAILLTHHHADHVDVHAYHSLGAPIFAHPDTAALAGLRGLVDHLVSDRTQFELAGMQIEALYTPGHSYDHVAYLVDRGQCFTGDVLFRGTVGGTRGPGGTDLLDLRRSIEALLQLPAATRLYPGHGPSTTVAEELAENPFIRAWRNHQQPDPEPCTVAGDPAELLLWGPDYDGTHKAWVRLRDGTEHIVGGSQVARQRYSKAG